VLRDRRDLVTDKRDLGVETCYRDPILLIHRPSPLSSVEWSELDAGLDLGIRESQRAGVSLDLVIQTLYALSPALSRPTATVSLCSELPLEPSPAGGFPEPSLPAGDLDLTRAYFLVRGLIAFSGGTPRAVATASSR